MSKNTISEMTASPIDVSDQFKLLDPDDGTIVYTGDKPFTGQISFELGIDGKFNCTTTTDTTTDTIKETNNGNN